MGIIRKWDAEKEKDSLCLTESVTWCFRGSGEHEWGILQKMMPSDTESVASLINLPLHLVFRPF